mgnify:FL=1
MSENSPKPVPSPFAACFPIDGWGVPGMSCDHSEWPRCGCLDAEGIKKVEEYRERCRRERCRRER